MDTNNLFTMALGLSSPSEMKELVFPLESKRLDIRLDFPEGPFSLAQNLGSLEGLRYGGEVLAEPGFLSEHGLLLWVSNGLMEGISSLIQVTKAKARGSQTTLNLLNIAYLLAGKLDIVLTQVVPYPHDSASNQKKGLPG